MERFTTCINNKCSVLVFLTFESYIQEKGFIVLGHCYKCDKVSYRSEEEAKIIAAEMCKKKKGHSYVYECPKGEWLALDFTKT